MGTVQLLSLILELLTFCVEHHTYHIKNYILHKDLLRRILVLMMSRHTFLVLGALRFMRKIVALKDEFYNRYIIKGNLFAPVIDALVKNNGRYNMMDSAICEMFEHIRSEDIKSLSTHVVENFGQIVDKVIYVHTFKALRQKYEQQQDRQKERSQAPLENVGSILRQGRFRRDPRQLEEEEEMWFNDDDYDEDVPTSASAANAASASTSSAASAAQPAAASAASTSAADPNSAETATTPASGATSLAASNVSSSSSATTSSDLSNSATGSGQDTGSGDAGPLAAVAAVAGSSVGFNSQQGQQQSSVTSTTNTGTGASNEVLSMAELAAGKLSESDRARASSPNSVKLTPLTNTKKVMALVDYDADSDEEEADDESENSPKKQKPNAASVSGAGKQTGNSSNDNDHSGKSEKEEAASIVVETTGSESSEELKTGNGTAEDSSEAATSDKIVVAPKTEAKESEQQEVPDSNEVENHENKTVGKESTDTTESDGAASSTSCDEKVESSELTDIPDPDS